MNNQIIQICIHTCIYIYIYRERERERERARERESEREREREGFQPVKGGRALEPGGLTRPLGLGEEEEGVGS